MTDVTELEALRAEVRILREVVEDIHSDLAKELCYCKELKHESLRCRHFFRLEEVFAELDRIEREDMSEKSDKTDI